MYLGLCEVSSRDFNCTAAAMAGGRHRKLFLGLALALFASTVTTFYVFCGRNDCSHVLPWSARSGGGVGGDRATSSHTRFHRVQKQQAFVARTQRMREEPTPSAPSAPAPIQTAAASTRWSDPMSAFYGDGKATTTTATMTAATTTTKRPDASTPTATMATGSAVSHRKAGNGRFEAAAASVGLIALPKQPPLRTTPSRLSASSPRRFAEQVRQVAQSATAKAATAKAQAAIQQVADVRGNLANKPPETVASIRSMVQQSPFADTVWWHRDVKGQDVGVTKPKTFAECMLDCFQSTACASAVYRFYESTSLKPARRQSDCFLKSARLSRRSIEQDSVLIQPSREASARHDEFRLIVFSVSSMMPTADGGISLIRRDQLDKVRQSMDPRRVGRPHNASVPLQYPVPREPHLFRRPRPRTDVPRKTPQSAFCACDAWHTDNAEAVADAPLEEEARVTYTLRRDRADLVARADALVNSGRGAWREDHRASRNDVWYSYSDYMGHQKNAIYTNAQTGQCPYYQMMYSCHLEQSDPFRWWRWHPDGWSRRRERVSASPASSAAASALVASSSSLSGGGGRSIEAEAVTHVPVKKLVQCMDRQHVCLLGDSILRQVWLALICRLNGCTANRKPGSGQRNSSGGGGGQQRRRRSARRRLVSDDGNSDGNADNVSIEHDPPVDDVNAEPVVEYVKTQSLQTNLQHKIVHALHDLAVAVDGQPPLDRFVKWMPTGNINSQVRHKVYEHQPALPSERRVFDANRAHSMTLEFSFAGSGVNKDRPSVLMQHDTPGKIFSQYCSRKTTVLVVSTSILHFLWLKLPPSWLYRTRRKSDPPGTLHELNNQKQPAKDMLFYNPSWNATESGGRHVARQFKWDDVFKVDNHVFLKMYRRRLEKVVRYLRDEFDGPVVWLSDNAFSNSTVRVRMKPRRPLDVDDADPLHQWQQHQRMFEPMHNRVYGVFRDVMKTERVPFVDLFRLALPRQDVYVDHVHTCIAVGGRGDVASTGLALLSRVLCKRQGEKGGVEHGDGGETPNYEFG